MAEYSIAIRTLGRAGEKYKALLRSIELSESRPKRVIVVLPEGYHPPEERLGWEEFVFCPKSMIGQRIEALKYIDTEYTLFLDDDIAFDECFVDRLLKPLEMGLFDCSTGPLFSFFPQSLAGRIAGTLTASVSISLFNRDKYVKILRSGGWSYHTFDTSQEHYYPTESFAWTCFMIRTDAMRKIRMEDEAVWLERFGYACGDDRVMAYKLVRLGYKACIVSNALYEHNDARTSTSSTEMENTKPVFCMYYMHVVFWHRFIQQMEKNRFVCVLNRMWLLYWEWTMTLYHLVKCINSQNRSRFRAYIEGKREGFRFIRSNEYRALANVICNAEDKKAGMCEKVKEI